MRRVILFIAASLDGYIADKCGSVDWLGGQDKNGEDADAYSAFKRGVDTVVMGWNTYHQIVTELSPAEWVYGDFTSYVITHRNLPSRDRIVFAEKDPCDIINGLKEKQGKDIWICGGASLIRQCLEADLIDEYQISVMPTILGGGIRLFDTVPKEIKLRLVHMRAYNGIVELIYTRR